MDEQIPNIITDPDYYDYLRTVYPQYGGMTSQQIATDLHKVLGNAAIKRACCLGLGDDENVEIKVKIPIPEPDVLTDPTSRRAQMYRKYNYFVKQIKVPRSLCNQAFLDGSGKWEAGTENCNLFYDVFCRNMLDRFNNVNNKEPKTAYDADMFNMYQTDCGCYGYIDPRLVPKSIPKKCYMKGCDVGLSSRKILYLDPASQTSSACVLNVCNQILDASKNTVGGNYNLNAMFKCDFSSAPGQNVSTPTVITGNSNDTKNAQNTTQNNKNQQNECVGVTSVSDGIFSSILARLTSIKQIQFDLSTFQESFNSGGIICAIKNHIPLLGLFGSMLLIIVCIFSGLSLIAASV